VWSVIQDHEFAECADGTGNAEVYGQRLINLALERRSDDNISVVVIHIHSLALVTPSAGRQGGWPAFLTRLKKDYGRSFEP
jgi:serine/threonine protein phosphatase PrpC